MLVEREHALGATGLHERRDLVVLAFPDEVPDGRGGEHDLGDDGPAGPVGARRERLGDHPAQRRRQLRAHLLLLVGREDVDDAVDGLGGALRVQRGQYEVTGLGRGQRGRGGLQVTQLADQDDVRVLAQRVLEGGRERVRVRPDLALVDQAALVLVQELDRVLDGDDVRGPGAVGQVEDRGQRRRLARPGRAGHQDQPAVHVGELGDRGRYAELLQALDAVRDGPERRAVRAALRVQVHAVAGDALDAVGEVQLLLAFELVPVFGRGYGRP